MHRRQLFRALGSLALGSTPAAWAAGVEIEGVRFEERITLGGRELLLNGTGMRAVAWFKGYAAALYLSRRTHSPEEVQSQPGPKRLRLVMLREAPTSELAKAFEKGVMRNATPEQQVALRERVDHMLEQMRAAGQVRKGDAVDLDYEPERGTTLLLNERARGDPVAGADFSAAILRAFVGAQPYQKSMRAGLLGVPE